MKRSRYRRTYTTRYSSCVLMDSPAAKKIHLLGMYILKPRRGGRGSHAAREGASQRQRLASSHRQRAHLNSPS